MEATNQELTHEKMIIVGNGFDMSAKIKSSYRDFINYIKAEEKLETNEEVYNFNKLFLQKFDGKDLNWNDLESIFESHIKEINSTTYNNDDEIRSRYSISEVNNCLSNLEELFFDYLEETYQDRMNVVKSEINQNKIFVNNVYEDIFSNASVINFNYTSTLFDLGLLENIKKRNLIDKNNSFSKINYYQLHGSIREKNIIFGGGFSGNNNFQDLYVPGSMDNDKLIRIKKDSELFEVRTHLISEINKFVDNSIDTFVLGHSIYGSDLTFLSRIFQKSRRIYLFYHESDYLIKLQMISKELGTDVLEKIVLVPFFEILINRKESHLIYDGSLISKSEEQNKINDDDIGYINRISSAPLPLVSAIKHFVLPKEHFIFKRISHLRISSLSDCETLLKIIDFIDIDNLSNNTFGLTIVNVGRENNKNKINELLDSDVFNKIVTKCSRIEISNSYFNAKKMVETLGNASNCNRLKITDSVFVYDEGDVDITIDLSKFPDLEFLNFSDNSIEAHNGIFSNSYIILESTRELVAQKLKKIIIHKNENFRYVDSLLYFAQNANHIELDYFNSGEFVGDFDFKNVSYFSIDGSEVDEQPFLSGIKLSSKIKVLKLKNVFLKDRKKISPESKIFRMSSLFKGECNLPNLEEIEISLYDGSKEFIFDILPATDELIWEESDIKILDMLCRNLNDDKSQNQKEVLDNKSSGIISQKNIATPIDTQTEKLNVEKKEEIEKIPKTNTFKNETNIDYSNSKDLIKNYIQDRKLFHSDNRMEVIEREASNISTDIEEFAKQWSIDEKALTYYLLNFDENKKKQSGETALKDSSDYERFPNKYKMSNLEYRKQLIGEVKEFVTRTKEKYNLG